MFDSLVKPFALNGSEQVDLCNNFRTTNQKIKVLFLKLSLISIFKKRKRQLIICVFLILKKAFNTVWHNSLLLKLQRAGVNGQYLQIN